MRRVAFLAAFLLVAAGCGGSSEPEEAAAPATAAAPEVPAATGPPATTATATGPAPSGAGPEITGDSLDGGRLSLADFRGKRVLVNVWSSW